MPQLIVDLSDGVVLDRPAFAAAAHALTVALVDAAPEDCKTRFRRAEDVHVGDGAPGQALAAGVIELLAGRPAALRTRLSEALLDLLAEHAAPPPGGLLHLSWDVRELDRDLYRKTSVQG
ncbi:isomerase [Streptomyces sp. NPDC089919]|uniref:5-carboxymethyl-2-hydroxymuconate Delta-isomerase n=1 Tax=Streptomyces sp. NPDC089919 TaxID=3155188 RepID=UPI0034320DC4